VELPETDALDQLLPTGGPTAVCRGVSKRYRTSAGVVVALDEVDLEIAAGSLVAVAGPSGSGKSTLLAMISCTDRPDSGAVEVQGIDVVGLSRRQRRQVRREHVAVVLAQPSDNLLDHLDVRQNIEWVAALRNTTVDVDRLLAQFGMADAGTKTVRQLSGGEQQRLAIASVLAGAPALVIADEPTASLDRANARIVIAALRRAAELGATVVVATHDQDVVAAADVAHHMAHGRLVTS